MSWVFNTNKGNPLRRNHVRICRTRTCIWSLLPAVIFETVQQASFLMLFLWFCVNRLRRHPRAWWSMMHCRIEDNLNNTEKWTNETIQSLRNLVITDTNCNLPCKWTHNYLLVWSRSRLCKTWRAFYLNRETD